MKKYLEFMNQFAQGMLIESNEKDGLFGPCRTFQKVASAKWRLIVIGRNVYDMSTYFNSNVEFLGPLVQSLAANYYGKDATQQWIQIMNRDSKADLYLNCMNALFFVGVVDDRFACGYTDFRESFHCQIQNWVLLGFTCVLCFVIICKFLAALNCTTSVVPEQQRNFVIITVPVYSEGGDSIVATLDSIVAAEYETRGNSCSSW